MKVDSRFQQLRISPANRPNAELREMLKSATKSFELFPSVNDAMGHLGCGFVWVRPIDVSARGGSEFDAVKRPDAVLFLLRLSGGIADVFGLASEIPVMIAAHSDIQSRLLVRASKTFEGISDREFDRDTIYLFTADSEADRVTLDEFTSSEHSEFVAIRGADSESFANEFVKTLESRNFRLNWYDKTEPVYAADFYGRKALLSALEKAVRDQAPQGVFGMRKTGKTSILHQLRYLQSGGKYASKSLNQAKVLVYFDLEGYDFVEEDEVSRMLKSLAENIRDELGAKGIPRGQLARLVESDEGFSIGQLFEATRKILRKNENLTLVLMLDEIEHVTTPASEEGVSSRKLVQFLQSLRKLVQETKGNPESGKFSLVVAGLASEISEAQSLHGEDNPFFRFMTPNFLGPLEREESDGLLASIGKKMGMNWSAEALDEAYSITDGNVILLRELGSLVSSQRKRGDYRMFEVERAAVQTGAEELPTKAKAYLSQALTHLEKRYPDEYSVVQLAVNESVDIVKTAQGLNVDPERLVQLGLLKKESQRRIGYSKLFEMAIDGIRAEDDARVALVNHEGKAEIRGRIGELVRLGESDKIEFKSTFLTPTDAGAQGQGSGKRDKSISNRLLFSAYRAIASFANSDGGELLVGIADDGTVIGIDSCIDSLGNEDKLTLHLKQKFDSFTTNGDIGIHYAMEIVDYRGRKVAYVSVKGGGTIFSYPKAEQREVASEVLFVRRGASTEPLTGSKLMAFLTAR